jgi:hypothetical protein
MLLENANFFVEESVFHIKNCEILIILVFVNKTNNALRNLSKYISPALFPGVASFFITI